VIGDQRGAVYLEMLVAYLPVLLFFFAVLQLADIAGAHLMVQRAAGAAVRAAVVVIPDDDAFYTGTDLSPAARKRADIERAADMVLGATRRLDTSGRNVKLDGESKIEHAGEHLRDPITARVSADYRCFAPLFCGRDGTVTLRTKATLPYQGARYRYASEEGWSDGGSW
jgi:hypothetical protein